MFNSLRDQSRVYSEIWKKKHSKRNIETNQSPKLSQLKARESSINEKCIVNFLFTGQNRWNFRGMVHCSCKQRSGFYGHPKGERCTLAILIVFSPNSTSMCFDNAFRYE